MLTRCLCRDSVLVLAGVGLLKGVRLRWSEPELTYGTKTDKRQGNLVDPGCQRVFDCAGICRIDFEDRHEARKAGMFAIFRALKFRAGFLILIKKMERQDYMLEMKRQRWELHLIIISLLRSWLLVSST